MKWLKENLIWILAPIVLFAGVAAYLYYSGGGGFGDDGVYNVR